MILLTVVGRVVPQMIDGAVFGSQQFELVLCEVADLGVFTQYSFASEQSATGRQRFDQRRFTRAVDTEETDAIARGKI